MDSRCTQRNARPKSNARGLSASLDFQADKKRDSGRVVATRKLPELDGGISPETASWCAGHKSPGLKQLGRIDNLAYRQKQRVTLGAIRRNAVLINFGFVPGD